MVAIPLTIESDYLVAGFLGFIIALVSSTVAISRAFFKTQEKIKLLDQELKNKVEKLNEIKTEVKELSNLFRDLGFSIIQQKNGIKSL